MKNIMITGVVGISLIALAFTVYKLMHRQPTTTQALTTEQSPQTAAEASDGKIEILKNKAELETFLSKNPHTVVKLSATWCPPCNAMKPIFSRLSLDTENIAFAEIDIDQFDEPQLFNARGIPAFIIYKNRKEHSRVIGSRTQEELKTEILKVTK